MLVPLDGSPESNVALSPARAMARATGASIVLLQVLDSRWPESSAVDASAIEAMDRLAHIAAQLTEGGIKVESVVRRGEAGDELVRQIRAQRADLVIIRTHGRTGLERVVLGSIAERVLSQSSVPVLLVRPGGRQIIHFRTILVPVDGSAVGALALASSAGLARRIGAAIHLLEVVVPVPQQAWTQSEGITYFDPAWDEQALARAQTYIDGLLSHLRAAGLQASGQARFAPDIPSSIVEVARAKAADMIVMSTHALTGLPRALLGSVADAVVRTGECPVLLIHRPSSRDGASSRLASEAVRA